MCCITAQKNKFNKKKESKLVFEMQPVKSCWCQGLEYSLQSTFVCDVQNLLQGLQWYGNSTVVSLSYLSMWYFLHQHVNPVKKEFKLSFPAVKLLCWGCFGSLRNVPVSTLKFVPFKDLQPFGASVAEEYPLTVKTTVLVSVGFIASVTCCLSLSLLFKANGLCLALRKWKFTVWLFSSACLFVCLLIVFVKMSCQQYHPFADLDSY